MRVSPLLLAALAGLSVLTAPLPAQAQDMRPGWIMPAQGRGEERQRLRPIREVIDTLRARYGGEYVGHRLEDGPRPTYVVRWRMPDGVTYRDFRVDAVSGR